MNIEQVALVLGKAAAVDNRDVGRAAVLAWNEIIGDLEFQDALAAVTRFRIESPGVYLEPGHVRRIAKVIRDERRKGEVVKALPSVPQNPAGAERVRQVLAELAAKRAIPEMGIERPVPPRSESIHERALARARAEKRLRTP